MPAAAEDYTDASPEKADVEALHASVTNASITHSENGTTSGGAGNGLTEGASPEQTLTANISVEKELSVEDISQIQEKVNSDAKGLAEQTKPEPGSECVSLSTEETSMPTTDKLSTPSVFVANSTSAKVDDESISARKAIALLVAESHETSTGTTDSSTAGEGGRVRQESVCVVEKQDLLQERDQPVIEDESLSIPIELLPGETLRRLGLCDSGDIIMLTTYRLFIAYPSSFLNIPNRMMESADSPEASNIRVTCKDGKVRGWKMPSTESCFKWLSAITLECLTEHAITASFAASFGIISISDDAWWFTHNESPYKLGTELKRLGFNLRKDWRISGINEDYSCCESYPRENVVPQDITDEKLAIAVKFRMKRRFPSVVWRNRECGSVLLRSSQPEVGFLYYRNEEDEALLQAITKACGCGDKKMLIADARSYAVAYANRAKGGGFEYPEYYTNADIQFMNLPNIHTVRSKFNEMRSLVATGYEQPNWYSQLEGTQWLTIMAGLLDASKFIAKNLVTRPVMVHCSDGWDRTPQLVSLAQIIIDPYYRTFKGFQILIAKDWLEFGHKFSDRCAQNGAITQEFSPIFLQWLDAVHLIAKQFPTAFEFNETYLIKLVHHVYSGMCGTFLCNNSKERSKEPMIADTVSIWSLLDQMKDQLINKLYCANVHKLLDVSSNMDCLSLWTNVYSPHTSQASTEPALEEGKGLRRSQSYKDISESTEANLHQASRRLSDPDLSSSMINLTDEPSDHAGAQLSSSAGFDVTNGSSSGASPGFVKLQGESRSRNNSGVSLKELEPAAVDSKRQHGLTTSTKKDVYQYSKYLDIDGQTTVSDPERQMMDEIVSNYKKKIAYLKGQLEGLKASRTSSGKYQTLVIPDSKVVDGGDSGPESACSQASDGSWESLSTHDSSITLWIPDHAALACALCNSTFQILRRKHHCRHCGQIFCTSCANQYIAIPSQQLYEPVRVCTTCLKLLRTKESETTSDGNDNSAPVTGNGEPGSNNSASSGSGRAARTEPIPIKRSTKVAGHVTPIFASGTPPTPHMSSSPLVGRDNAHGYSKKNLSNASSGSPGCQKTCSQESINADTSVENMMPRGAKV